MKPFIFIIMLLSGWSASSAWVTQNSGTTRNLGALHFFSADTGLVVGDSGTVLYTTNGGSSWSRRPFPDSVTSLVMIQFLGRDTGWVAGGRSLYRTTNGGQTWSLQSQDSLLGYWSLSFVNGSLGWATKAYSPFCGTTLICYGTRLLKTTDGGQHWSLVDSSYRSGFVSEVRYLVRFVNANTGWHLGGYSSYDGRFTTHYPLLSATTSGGATWTAQTPSSDLSTYQDAWFANANRGWVVGGYRTGGAVPQGPAVPVVVHASIARTANGGAGWTHQDFSAFGQYLNAVHFLGTDTGYVVGSSGAILRSVDAGQVWVQQVSPVTTSLSSVRVASPTAAYAVGQGGVILKGNPSVPTSVSRRSPLSTLSARALRGRVEFQVPRPLRVSVTLHDARGARVLHLPESELAAGVHRLVIPDAQLPAGMYWIEIRAGSIRQTVVYVRP